MVSTYQPKTAYFTPERVQKASKDLIKQANDDRLLIQTHYNDLMDIFEKDTENTVVLQEATKTLSALIKATDKVVKILDNMTKLNISLTKDEEDSLEGLDTKLLNSFLSHKNKNE
ncbi:hypothetical protein HOE37_06630 [Candidatus Woesearchaeota archaeon]|jgi:hypothetical protein|nr:hypothetical protein [Candidatus Woesearchaeota archaeon]